MITRWKNAARDGVEVLGADTPVGARIAETLAFFEFVQEELPAILKRWQGRRAQLRAPVADTSAARVHAQ